MQLTEIPALPVLVPAAFVVLLLVVLRMRRQGTATAPRIVLIAALCVYGVGLLRSVLLPYPIVVGVQRGALPPWQVFVQPVPLATVPEDPSGMVLNVLLFVPLGVMLPMVLRRPLVVPVLVVGFTVSLLVELVQLVGDVTISTGRVADVDDLIGNTTGTLVGFLLFLLITRLPLAREAATAASLPDPALHLARPAAD